MPDDRPPFLAASAFFLAIGWWATALVAGVPEIVGATLPSNTSIENGASSALNSPSLTLMTMFECVPISPAAGVPVSARVVESKVSHAGRGAPLVSVADHVNGSPSASANMVAGNVQLSASP